MRSFAFTVDLDRDVNQACKGRSCAVSQAIGDDDSPRFSASARGLELLVDLLNDLDVQGVFFCEGRTVREISREHDLAGMLSGHEIACHGYDHEDLTGESTEVPLSKGELDDILERSISTVREIFGTGDVGFRAPYLRRNDALDLLLAEKGFRYDSSMVMPLQQGMVRPFRNAAGMMEVPIASGNDRQGKRIVAYLWPWHEGKRSMEDYLQLVDQFQEGLFVMATHTWHLVECFGRGPLSPSEVDVQIDQLRDLLLHVLDQGEIVRIDDYLRDNQEG